MREGLVDEVGLAYGLRMAVGVSVAMVLFLFLFSVLGVGLRGVVDADLVQFERLELLLLLRLLRLLALLLLVWFRVFVVVMVVELMLSLSGGGRCWLIGSGGSAIVDFAIAWAA